MDGRKIGRPKKIVQGNGNESTGPVGQTGEEGKPEPEPVKRDPGERVLFDPGQDTAGIGDTGEPIKRRKRRSSQAEAPENIATLSGVLFSIHNMLASFLKVEEFELDEGESEKLATAIARVQKLYNVKFLSEEAAAWVNLTTVGVSVYGPRVAAYRLRTKKERPQPVPTSIAAGPHNVILTPERADPEIQ